MDPYQFPKKIKKALESKDFKELTVNSLWSFAGSIVSKAFLFGAWLMVAKMLGKEGNGEVGIIRSTINLFAIFAGSGIAMTTTKYIPEYLDNDRDKVSRIISLTILVTVITGVLLSFGMYVGAEYIAEGILNAPNLTDTFRISAFVLFLSAITSLISGCLKGFGAFRELSYINTYYGVGLFVFLYFGTKYYDIEGTFIGFTLSSLLLAVLGLYHLWKHMGNHRLFFTLSFKEEYNILKKFTLPAILTGIMVVPFKWTADTILVNQPNGFQQLGLYNVVILFQTFMVMLTTTIDAPLITLMVKENISKKIERLSLIMPWAIGVFMVLPILFFPNLFGYILGEEYAGDVNFKGTLFLILITTTIMLYKQGIARVMIVNGLMWFSFFSNLVWGLLLLATFYFVWDKNSTTLSFSYFMAYLLNTVIILPIYLKMKIISPTLIISKTSLAIWIFFFLIIWVLYYYEVNMIVRALLMVFFLGMFAFLFYKLITKK